MPINSPKFIYFSLLAALLLELLPWSGIGILLHPDFVLLTLLYWLLRAPNVCNIGTAWLAGLAMDLAMGGLFGQHALAYALTAFFVVSYQRRLTLFNAWQQAGYIFVLLLLTQITLVILKLFASGQLPGWEYFLASVSGLLLWQLFVFTRLGTDVNPRNN